MLQPWLPDHKIEGDARQIGGGKAGNRMPGLAGQTGHGEPVKAEQDRQKGQCTGRTQIKQYLQLHIMRRGFAVIGAPFEKAVSEQRFFGSSLGINIVDAAALLVGHRAVDRSAGGCAGNGKVAVQCGQRGDQNKCRGKTGQQQLVGFLSRCFVQQEESRAGDDGQCR